MGVTHDKFMDRLRRVIVEHEARISRLESGEETIYRTSRSGEKEDISLRTADHYRRLVTHFKEVVGRHDAKLLKLKEAEKSGPA
jgi:hypothetical protein